MTTFESLLEQTPVATAFLVCLDAEHVKPAARPHFIRWASTWSTTADRSGPNGTTAFFDGLGRNTAIADWQFRQAVDAARILARDVLHLPWAETFDWRGLADQARALGPGHRTLLREARTVYAAGLANAVPAGTQASPPGMDHRPPACGLASSSPSDHAQAAGEAEEVQRIDNALRRSIRLANLAVATETTYTHWCRRFTRFCFRRLGQGPAALGPPAITAYLDCLALECRVSPATQKQALNAMAYLTRHVFAITDIRTVQTLLGHSSVETTMIYLHVVKRPGAGAPSPLDLD